MPRIHRSGVKLRRNGVGSEPTGSCREGAMLATRTSLMEPELNDYEDEDEEEDAFEEEQEADDDASALVDQLGDVLTAKDSPCLETEDEKLVDLLQRRLFLGSDSSQEDPKASSTRQSTRCSLEEFIADRSPSQSRFDHSLLESFSREQHKAPTLSPEKLTQMTTRFRIFEEKKARRLTAKRRETEKQETSGFDTATIMNSRSRQLTSHLSTFTERQAALQDKKRQQQARVQQQQERERTRDRALDLQESVKTPCICSHGNSNRSTSCLTGETSPVKLTPSSETVDVRHTPACLRFMAMCSKMNASFAIQRKKELMTRSIDDMIAYHEGKKERQQARLAVAQAQEARQTTFTPQINAKSEKIYAAMMRSGKLELELSDRIFKPRKPLPMPPKLSFQPRISKKSKWLLRKKQRELAVSAAGEPSLAASSTDLQSPSRLDVFSRLQQLSSHRESAANHLHTEQQEASKATPPAEWTVVQYDAASCSFILQGFSRPPATLS